MSQTYASGRPTYYRLSERSNRNAQSVTFGKAEVIHTGKGPTVVTVGPFLDRVVEALEGTDATILYYTTITPFDAATLQQHVGDGRILCVEPFYEGTLAGSITQALRGKRIALSSMGVPRQFLTSYGHADYHDRACGLMPADIRARYDELLHV
jgi:transketolase